jgi:hypothetical protein
VTLKISSLQTSTITSDWDLKDKMHIARKAGFKYVSGESFKQRTAWKKTCDFMSASRGPAIVGKAHFESKHYVQGAILRKLELARSTTPSNGAVLTNQEYDETVWDSGGVQNRVTREDFIRYHPEHYSTENGASKRNVLANKLSCIGHTMHGLCEMGSSATGMTSTITANVLAPGTHEKSTKHKVLMASKLGFIGLATTELLISMKKLTGDLGLFLGQSLSTVLVAFPAFSSTFGALGFIAGLASQAVVQKQPLSETQKQSISQDLNVNLQKLLFRMKTIKDKPQLIDTVAKAMQGRHLLKKIKSDSLDQRGVPILLTQILESIDQNATDFDNIRSMTQAIGRYLQVNKPNDQEMSLWARYSYAKAVTVKESHYVALIGLVDHMDVHYPEAAKFKDLRRKTEEIAAPAVHSWLLNLLAKPAAVFDAIASTHIAPKLRNWASPDHRKAHAAKIHDPLRASKNCFRGEYIAHNLHQYKPITRSLMILAEGMRLVNMNIVLASNANLSRIFNNIASSIQTTLGTGPASRSMCQSAGRFFGGALLAIIFGTFISIGADSTGQPSSVPLDLGSNRTVDVSFSNIGILMFILAVPTLLVKGLALAAARVEGWEGNIHKTAKPSPTNFDWPTERQLFF